MLFCCICSSSTCSHVSPHPEAKPFGLRFCLQLVSSITPITPTTSATPSSGLNPLSKPFAPATGCFLDTLSAPFIPATRIAYSDGGSTTSDSSAATSSSVAPTFSTVDSMSSDDLMTAPSHHEPYYPAGDDLGAFNSMFAAMALSYSGPPLHGNAVDNYLGAFDGMLAAMALSYPVTDTHANTNRRTYDEDWEEDSVFFPFN